MALMASSLLHSKQDKADEFNVSFVRGRLALIGQWRTQGDIKTKNQGKIRQMDVQIRPVRYQADWAPVQHATVSSGFPLLSCTVNYSLLKTRTPFLTWRPNV